MIVVAGRVVERREPVGLHALAGLGRQPSAQLFHIAGVSGKFKLVVVGKPVESNVLSPARCSVVVKGVGERVLIAHTSPRRSAHKPVVAVGRNSVLIRLQPILEYILGYLSEIEIQVAPLGIGVFRIEKRVHEPELHILDIALLEIRVVETPHDAAPAFFGLQQPPLIVDTLRVNIVGTALFGIERQIESLYGRRFAIGELTVGENLARCHLAHIRI